jgi:AAA family ATP:ADP antiporter
MPAREDEAEALLWSFGYFFFLLAAYYLLRPLRDAMGIAGGVRHLPWLFTASFVALILVQPVFSELVARLPRRRFIPLIYHFFAANLMIFWLLLRWHVGTVYLARLFFVWVGVFNLFVVSVFWSFMADIYTSEQSKRLFGIVGAGGTAGGLLGPLLAVSLSGPVGATNLLVISTLLLEMAVLCAQQLERAASRLANRPNGLQERIGELNLPRPDMAIGGGALEGAQRLVRSPYLAGIAVWVSLMSFCATVLYLQQENIVASAVHNHSAQTRIFASIDLSVGLLTLVTQMLATGPLILRFGVGAAAACLPFVFAGGFVAVAAAPQLITIMVVQAIQRAAHFAISTPARQAFFTVVDRQDKYKVKNLIDLVVYRGSDAIWSWLFLSLKKMGLSLSAIAAASAPMAMVWLVVSLVLGRTLERRARSPYAYAG